MRDKKLTLVIPGKLPSSKELFGFKLYFPSHELEKSLSFSSPLLLYSNSSLLFFSTSPAHPKSHSLSPLLLKTLNHSLLFALFHCLAHSFSCCPRQLISSLSKCTLSEYLNLPFFALKNAFLYLSSSHHSAHFPFFFPFPRRP